MTENKVDVVSLFKKLIAAVNNDDSKAILESCNTITQVLPDDKDAQKCRIVCYINMGKYDDAIKVIDGSAHDFFLERVYCLYLKQKFEEALDLLNQRKSDDNNVKLLKAQILYRMEKYEESLELYKSAIKSEEYDYLTNLSACYLLSEHYDEGASLLEKYKDSQSYEVLYNYGTLLIYFNKLDEAHEVLQRALRLGRSQLREGDELAVDVEEDGDEPELDPIRVQLSYISTVRGDKATAERLLLRVLTHGSSSKVISAVASCNLVACRGASEIAEGYKRLRAIPADVQSKLTSVQQSALRFNRAVLLLLLNRRKEFETLLGELTVAEASVIRVCDMLVRGKDEEALQALDQIKEPNVDLCLLHLQVLLNHQQYEKVLARIPDLPPAVLHTPAIQSLFFAVLNHVRSNADAPRLIQAMEVAAQAQEQDAITSQRAAADYFYDSHDFEAAASRYRQILATPSLEPTQRIAVTARLVLAASHSSRGEAQRLADQLPEVGIVEDVDVNQLEEMLRRREYLKQAQQQSETPAPAAMEEEEPESAVENIRKMEAEKKKKLNLKKRQKKAAKFIAALKEAGKYRDPSTLDPERWLAKEDRTLNKRRNKKNTVSITGVGAQGEHVSQAEMDRFDAKKRSENPTAVSQIVKDKSNMRRKKGGKKGKK